MIQGSTSGGLPGIPSFRNGMKPVASICKTVSPFIIREAARSDIPQIIALANSLYDYRRDERFFVWQCFENANPAVLMIAEENHAIVGMYGIQKMLTNTGLIGGQISWINIAPHKQGTGLFDMMSQHAQSRFPELDFIFIFANDAAVEACRRSLGMKFIGSLNRLILNNPSCAAAIESRCDPIDMDTEFNPPVSHADCHYFCRDDRYRRWRYAKSPVYRYYRMTTDRGASAVFKLFGQGAPSVPSIGDIVDFDCNLTDTAHLKHLFQTACGQLRQMGAETITTWAVPTTPHEGILKEIGFIESKHRSFFGIKVLHEQGSDLYNFAAWHLVQSDATNY